MPDTNNAVDTITPDNPSGPQPLPAEKGANKPRAAKRKPRARGRKNRQKGEKVELWRYTAGDHGHAVTVFQKKGKRNIHIEVWNPKTKAMERSSLGHDDQELARKQAWILSDKIRLETAPIIGAGGEPTVETLLHLYQKEHSDTLGGSQPKEHDRRRRMWLGYCAAQRRPIEHPRDLDQPFFNKFVSDRRHGDIDVPGIGLPAAAPKPTHPAMKREAVVADGTIDADLIYLNAALNWAANYRVNGEPLLKNKPRVPRCRPQVGTLRQPLAYQDDLEALRPVLDSVDPQGLLSYWVDLVDQYGWRVTGTSCIRACEIEFAPRPNAPHGRLKKNALVDKERRDDYVPLTPYIAGRLCELLALRGLKEGDDAFLFVAPKSGGTRPWSRWHVGRLLVRAEQEAKIAHIGGLHAWRRKWHTERKNYPIEDIATAAGYADPRSVQRYRHADPETTFLVVTTPTHTLRRAGHVTQTTGAVGEGAAEDATDGQASPAGSGAENPVGAVFSAPRRRIVRRGTKREDTAPAAAAEAVGQGHGSAARSTMPNGTVVEDRDQRFEANLAAAKAYAAEHGHLMPRKADRPHGVNLLMWLKNQELRIEKGTMPPGRRAALDAIPAWRERLAKRGIGA